MPKAAKPPARPCFEVTFHFRDEGLAKGTYDAASLDEDAMWKVTMKKGAD